MYINVTRFDKYSSWRAFPRIYEDREKAAVVADKFRDVLKGEEVRTVWIDEPDNWPKQ